MPQNTLFFEFSGSNKASKERVRNSARITSLVTLLKIAVENVILELCDSCDYLASRFTNVKKTMKFNRDC